MRIRDLVKNMLPEDTDRRKIKKIRNKCRRACRLRYGTDVDQLSKDQIVMIAMIVTPVQHRERQRRR